MSSSKSGQAEFSHLWRTVRFGVLPHSEGFVFPPFYVPKIKAKINSGHFSPVKILMLPPHCLSTSDALNNSMIVDTVLEGFLSDEKFNACYCHFRCIYVEGNWVSIGGFLTSFWKATKGCHVVLNGIKGRSLKCQGEIDMRRRCWCRGEFILASSSDMMTSR